MRNRDRIRSRYAPAAGWRLVPCVALVFLLSTFGAFGADPTVQELLDAIFADTYDPLLDLNGDGAIDVADIVCLKNFCHKDVRFAQIEQTVDEKTGEVKAYLDFDWPPGESATLKYSVKGTATSGDDFEALSGQATIGAGGDYISIQIKNDSILDEPLETIILTLEANEETGGYRVAGPSSHVISIADNDSSWHGSLETSQGRVAIRMTLTDTDDPTPATTCELVSDGDGTLPCLSPDPDGFCRYDKSCTLHYVPDIDGDTFDELVGFDVAFDPISMPEGSNSLGLTLDRTFTFHVDATASCEPSGAPCLDDTQCSGESCVPSVEGHIVNETILSGAFGEQALYGGGPHLNREVRGTFTMQRQSPAPAADVTLYDLP